MYFLGRLRIEDGRIADGMELVQQAADLGETAACYYIGTNSNFSASEQKRFLDKGHRRGNVFCRLILGKKMLKERRLQPFLIGVWLIGTSFPLAVLKGVRHKTVASLRRDPAFDR